MYINQYQEPNDDSFTFDIGSIGPIELPDQSASQTLDILVDFARQESRLYGFADFTRDLNHACQSDTCIIGNVYRFVKAHMRFRPDPQMRLWTGEMVATEKIARPSNILNDIRRQGQSAGDCDDYAVLAATILRASGCKAGYRAIATWQDGTDRLDHVFCVCKNRDLANVTVSLDPLFPYQTWHGHRFKEVWT